MKPPIKKAAGGFETTTATALHNATDSIATCARPASHAGVFKGKPCARVGKTRIRVLVRRDETHDVTFHDGFGNPEITQTVFGLSLVTIPSKNLMAQRVNGREAPARPETAGDIVHFNVVNVVQVVLRRVFGVFSRVGSFPVKPCLSLVTSFRPGRRCPLGRAGMSQGTGFESGHHGAARGISGVFKAAPCTGSGQTRQRRTKRCDTIQPTPAMGPVRKNIVIESGAQTHALSGFFHVLKLSGTGSPAPHGYGRDGLVRKAGRMADSMFLTSRPPFSRKNGNGGFLSQSGAESMTTVNTPATPKSGTLTLGNTPGFSPVPLARRLAIETALIAALFHIRMGDTQQSIEQATGRATRAASMLKQACEASTTTSAGRV